MGEKLHTLALRRLLPQQHSHSVAHFRASSGLFAEGWRRARKSATGWLCWQSAANCSPCVKFPDHRENRGNYINIGPIVRYSALSQQSIGGEIPWLEKQGIFLTKQGVSASQKGNPKVCI
jgi:hypothetical protein